VCGFLTDPRGGNGMRAGGMTSDNAFSQLVATPQLMSRRERPDRGERAQGRQRQATRPPTEPRQHLLKVTRMTRSAQRVRGKGRGTPDQRIAIRRNATSRPPWSHAATSTGVDVLPVLPIVTCVGGTTPLRALMERTGRLLA
jgi:hypothetical protein